MGMFHDMESQLKTVSDELSSYLNDNPAIKVTLQFHEDKIVLYPSMGETFEITRPDDAFRMKPIGSAGGLQSQVYSMQPKWSANQRFSQSEMVAKVKEWLDAQRASAA